MRVVHATVLLGFFDLAIARPHSSLAIRDFDPDNLPDDATWDKFSCKGVQLLQAMLGSDADAAKIMGLPSAQSIWKGDLKQDMANWGYTEGYVSYINCDLKGYWNVESACKDLGIDTRPKMLGGPNICYNFNHFHSNKDNKGSLIPKAQQTYKANNKEYRVTGAELQIGVNPVSGVIFQQYVTSPKTAAQNLWNRNPSLDELPQLRALSDIMWGVWNRENGDIRNIHYFWVQGVGNRNTKNLIARALKEAGTVLERWPGTIFDTQGTAGQAILASANGACFAYFLSQHKAELGNMHIDKVHVFKNDRSGSQDPDLLFFIVAPKA